MPLAPQPHLARALMAVTILLALLPPARPQAVAASERTPACPAFEDAYGEYHLGFGGAVFHRSELESRPALFPSMRDGLAALAAALRARWRRRCERAACGWSCCRSR